MLLVYNGALKAVCACLLLVAAELRYIRFKRATKGMLMLEIVFLNLQADVPFDAAMKIWILILVFP